MRLNTILPVSFIAAGVSAQSYVSVSPQGGTQYAVNIPSNTASSRSGPIYMAIVAPSGTQWVGLGQGSAMAGSNIFMVYSDGNGNVTVSPRLGKGPSEPQHDTSSQITVLDGSYSHSDGSMIAYVRCDSCLSWSGGSMSPTSSNSNWIWGIKLGSPIDSTSLTENLAQHDSYSTFTLDLTKGTGGSSSNPFIVGSSTGSSSASGGAASNTASATAGFGSSATTQAPFASATGASSSSSSTSSTSHYSTSNTNTVRSAHAIIMSILFLLFFPLFALTLYLPFADKVRWVHAPLQILSIILLIVGLALGIILGQKLDLLDGYHQVIGYVVVGCLVVFQPALGIYQHLYYRKTGGRSALGVFHQWLGRGVILLGVFNGGVGFMQSGPVGSLYVPSGAVVGYGIVAVLVFIIYVIVVVLAKRRQRRTGGRVRKQLPADEMGHDMRQGPAQSYDRALPAEPGYGNQSRRPGARPNIYPAQDRDYYLSQNTWERSTLES